MTIYYEATIKQNDDLLEAHMLIPFITSMLTLTLAMNVLTTCMHLFALLHHNNSANALW